MSTIVVESAGKEYLTADSRRVTGLEPVSLQIRRGSFVSFVGRSGCGKSTLLRLIAGLETSTWGSISIDGAEVSQPPSQLRYVFQSYSDSLLPWKSVGRNVEFGIRHAHRLPETEQNRRNWPAIAQRRLSDVGLGDKATRYPSELSGGQQQRVAIARALASHPEILLLDEPFSAVDALSRSHLQDLVLQAWHELGLTVVFVTHDIDEALYLSDEIYVLAPNGRGIQDHIHVDLPRPRNQLSTPSLPEFSRARARLLSEVLGDEL
ncbi:ABC transporter ATP-binding protein [Paenarthrobacter sp. NPDC089316]|uniref:ABC transporter ATP-binding protein n=1 Tax=unclassified Paenarthrobacter TaxID=2634190 RepID=UPI003445C39F